MTRMVVRTSVYLALMLGSVTSVALGARRDWTGSAACGACHPGELAAWQVTPHARTRDRFASRPRPPRIALLIGTEGAGLSAGLESAADYRVRIPISDRVDSLNLAVAAGIALARLAIKN